MPLSTDARNAAIAVLAAQATHLSLHTDVPGDDGLNEVIGGTPTYARLPCSWLFPAVGAMSLAAAVTFDVPPGPVAYVGMWSALVGGDFLGYAPLNGGALYDTAYARPATNDFLSPAHGLIVGDRVSLLPLPGQTPPTGVTGALYHVAAVPSLDAFQVSLTAGGDPIALLSNESVLWQRCAVDVFAAQGTVQVSTLSFVIGA